MSTDWVGEGFAAMRDCGDDISIVYAQVPVSPAAGVQPEPRWCELPHDRFDGVSGFVKLLRDQGVEPASPPRYRGLPPGFWSTLRGLLAVAPALRIRVPRWRRFSDVRRSTLREPRARVAWRLLTEAQTQRVVAAAREAGVSVNTYLLSHLDRAVTAQLAAPGAPRLWMIPVNLRGALPRTPEHFLQMSFLAADVAGEPAPRALQAMLDQLRLRGCHWGSWTAMHVGRLLGAAALRRELRRRAAQNDGWTGIFSNLGVWEVPGAGHWLFGPAVARAQPVGAGCITMNGRMALTVQLHEALGAELGPARALLDAWTAGWLRETTWDAPAAPRAALRA